MFREDAEKCVQPVIAESNSLESKQYAEPRGVSLSMTAGSDEFLSPVTVVFGSDLFLRSYIVIHPSQWAEAYATNL